MGPEVSFKIFCTGSTKKPEEIEISTIFGLYLIKAYPPNPVAVRAVVFSALVLLKEGIATPKDTFTKRHTKNMFKLTLKILSKKTSLR
jgi:hypothetical protein